MKRSIHFGLNGVDPAAYGGWPGWLNACVSDARDMAALCARAGFTAKAFYDSACTNDRLKAELMDAADTLGAGDTFLMSYSGHGGQSPAWSFSGYKETLCLYDGELADTALREFFALFKAGVRVVFVSDSCQAGGLSRAFPITRNKPTFVKSDVVLPFKAEQEDLKAGMLLIAASQADELSADGDRNGAFTAALLKVADDFEATSRPLIYDDWIAAVKTLMLEQYPTQHPVIEHYGAPTDWNVEVNSP